MLSLAIHHTIHLSKEQRLDLHQGKDLTAVGVSVPVWFSENLSSEPAQEVFCNYYLRNPKIDKPIKILDDGYEIALPYREGVKLSISDDEYRQLRLQNPKKLAELSSKTVSEVSSRNLLDLYDGGSGCLIYRETNKIKIDKGLLNVMHYICFYAMERLTKSL